MKSFTYAYYFFFYFYFSNKVEREFVCINREINHMNPAPIWTRDFFYIIH